MKIKVYTASKISLAPFWRKLREDPLWGNVEFVARWPIEHAGHVPDTEEYARLFWQEDLADIWKAHVVLVYGEPDQKLRGALVEAGMGIALGKTIVVVGGHPDYGTWQWHPLVYRRVTLESARVFLNGLAPHAD